jgi:hypothetical protein
LTNFDDSFQYIVPHRDQKNPSDQLLALFDSRTPYLLEAFLSFILDPTSGIISPLTIGRGEKFHDLETFEAPRTGGCSSTAGPSPSLFEEVSTLEQYECRADGGQALL